MAKRYKGRHHPSRQAMLASLEMEIGRTKGMLANEQAYLSRAGMPARFRSDKIVALDRHLDGLIARRYRLGSYESRR